MNDEKVQFGSSEYKKLSVEGRLEVLEDVVAAILASKREAEAPTKQDNDVAALMDKVKTKNAIIICYRKMGSQTKEQAKEVLRKWGTPFGSWFNGGNFAARLVRKGILMPEGKNDNGRTIYSLTIRGRKLADEILQELKASS